jgi:hypothetical protein
MRIPTRTESLLILVVFASGCSDRAAARVSDVVDLNLPDATGRIEKIAAAYGIEVVAARPHFPVQTLHGEINGQACSEIDLRGYAKLLADEFSLYPPDLVRHSRLRRIVLCTGLTFARQSRGAVPDFEHDTLYLDVAVGSHDGLYRRAVIHHEFFHLLDYQDDGLVYEDPLWKALNATDFAYGDGGRNAQSLRHTAVLTDRYPGFLNHYSTTGIEEDKAELFAQLLVRPAHVESRAKSDLVLGTKVELLKRQLALFCPAVNHGFWNASAARKR